MSRSGTWSKQPILDRVLVIDLYARSCEDGYLYYICTVSQLCSMFAQLLLLKVKGL